MTTPKSENILYLHILIESYYIIFYLNNRINSNKNKNNKCLKTTTDFIFQKIK